MVIVGVFIGMVFNILIGTVIPKYIIGKKPIVTYKDHVRTFYLSLLIGFIMEIGIRLY